MQEKVSRVQPRWIPLCPRDESLSKLMLFNSLTMQKEIFVPTNGKSVEWYSCGPTVYDISHLGHARTYVTIDVMRRLMKDYLGFDVHYVMNITDIDDKIIKRARQNLLFGKYISSSPTEYEVRADIQTALSWQRQKISNLTNADVKNMHTRELDKALVAFDSLSDCFSSLAAMKGIFSAWLDSHKADSVSADEIAQSCSVHAQEIEQKFNDDMSVLNVMPADEITRVSEYIPKIITFVEKLISKGFAYVRNGSVYFSTKTFDKSEGHFYAKLVPAAYGNDSLLNEGEGDLTTSDCKVMREKESLSDFALWKASKAGEPKWSSPWGEGRPGWHIECSVMATDKCGSHLDIHTGGIDLKFPHHDNELAQSEAHEGHSNWVRYFVHIGHLHIDGCKMSKSLKNFISIRDALGLHGASSDCSTPHYSTRQLRLSFLLSDWRDTFDYTQDCMEFAMMFEKLIEDFCFSYFRCTSCSATLSHDSLQNGDSTNEHREITVLARAVQEAERDVDLAIRDSFDTKRVLITLKELINHANLHMAATLSGAYDLSALKATKKIVLSILQIIGVADASMATSDDPGVCIGFRYYSSEQITTTLKSTIVTAKLFYAKIKEIFKNDDDVHNKLDLFENKLVAFQQSQESNESTPISCLKRATQLLAESRQTIRTTALASKEKSALETCDWLRDVALPDIGIRLQDTENQDAFSIGIYPRDLLLKELAEKATKKKAKPKIDSSKKLSNKSQNAPNVSADTISKEILSCDIFRNASPFKGKFATFDEDGIPLTDVNGEKVSKTQRSKLIKIQKNHEKRLVNSASSLQ